MNILVTGSAGFAGKNIVEYLKTLADGRNRTRPNLTIGEIYEYDRNSTPEDLDYYCQHADFILHFAGINRPKEQSEFMEGNFGFTSTILDALKKYNNRAPIVISSSVQATLSGRFGNSEYGRSKLAGEELMFSYGAETGAPVYVYRFSNLVGKWGRANYNSATITFAYNIARNLPITVNDPSVELELLFIDDLIDEMLDCMEGHPHRCEYPKAGEKIDGVTYDGVTARFCEDGRYCSSPITHHITLGRIVELFESFRDQPKTLMVPDLTPGTVEYKLYCMYISYLPKEAAVFDLKMNVDDRGSFTELLKSSNAGMCSVNITRPGHITKGLHWHAHRLEQFIVVSGHGLIQERNLATNEVIEFEVSGDKIQSVFQLPGWSHAITNLSETEPLVTIMWAESVFNPEKPDTFRVPVILED